MMFICDVLFDTKDDPILQNSYQVPAMSSKCDDVPDVLQMKGTSRI